MAEPFLRADWPAPAGIHALTTTRHGPGRSRPPFDRGNLGMRCGDVAEDVLVNRQRLVEALSLPAHPHWLQQVHGTSVVQIDQRIPFGGDTGVSEEPAADAAVTRQSGTVLAILSADCLPVVFCSADGGEIAAAHAGWRGLAAGVLEATVAAMQAPASRLLVWLGPAAGPDAYEIGAEVRDAFIGPDSAADSAFVATRPGHWRVDLYSLARRRLAAMGVTQVYGGGLCTISDAGRFFSHRRDQRTGRMATLIWRD